MVKALNDPTINQLPRKGLKSGGKSSLTESKITAAVDKQTETTTMQLKNNRILNSISFQMDNLIVN